MAPPSGFAEPLLVGDPEHVGRYRIIGRLGAGGMGRVYLGETPEGVHAAVKVVRDDLADDTAFRARFRREVAAAAAVAGIFTARVLDADPDADRPWLATQYVEGSTLAAAVARHGPLPEAALLDLARGLAEALAAIHAAGLVHRDLKPANVLLSPAGPRVIDFGIARAVDASRLTGTGQIVGTPGYMAPEQIDGSGDVGPAGDVFALGSTLAFAATGRGPFDAAGAAATFYRILNAEPDLRGLPPVIVSLVAACLAKDPAARPAAAPLAASLRAGRPLPGTTRIAPATVAQPPGPAPGAPATVAQPPGPAPGTPAAVVPPPGPAPALRRHRRPLVAGAAVLLVAGGVAAAVVLAAPAVPAPPKPAPTSAATAATAAPDSPQARYVDRLCATGSLLTALGQTATVPPATSDPAQARRDYLASADRTIGTVDAAVADLTVLRDDAPNDAVRAQFGLIVDRFTKARTAFAAGRAAVRASDPLTVAAYRTGVDRFADGAGDLALAAQLVQQITLPPAYTAASASAPGCRS